MAFSGGVPLQDVVAPSYGMQDQLDMNYQSQAGMYAGNTSGNMAAQQTYFEQETVPGQQPDQQQPPPATEQQPPPQTDQQPPPQTNQQPPPPDQPSRQLHYSPFLFEEEYAPEYTIVSVVIMLIMLLHLSRVWASTSPQYSLWMGRNADLMQMLFASAHAILASVYLLYSRYTNESTRIKRVRQAGVGLVVGLVMVSWYVLAKMKWGSSDADGYVSDSYVSEPTISPVSQPYTPGPQPV